MTTIALKVAYAYFRPHFVRIRNGYKRDPWALRAHFSYSVVY